MAAQVNFCLFLNALFCLACNTVPENRHICVDRDLAYLQYRFIERTAPVLINRAQKTQERQSMKSCLYANNNFPTTAAFEFVYFRFWGNSDVAGGLLSRT